MRTSVEDPPQVDETETYQLKLEKTRLLREKLKQEYSTKRDTEMKFEESKIGGNPEEIPSIYNFLPVALLGEGTYGQVYLVEDINSGNKFAMKKLDKDQVVENGMMRYT
jgi:hypothetical protein